jgi:hypothetical protein
VIFSAILGNILRKNWRFSLKPMLCMIKCLQKLANIFAKFFFKNIGKIKTIIQYSETGRHFSVAQNFTKNKFVEFLPNQCYDPYFCIKSSIFEQKHRLFFLQLFWLKYFEIPNTDPPGFSSMLSSAHQFAELPRSCQQPELGHAGQLPRARQQPEHQEPIL